MAVAIVINAKIRTGRNQGLSVFLKELKRTTGPIKDRGKAPARNLRPFSNRLLFVFFIFLKDNYSFAKFILITLLLSKCLFSYI
jgi:hypothetical protein